MDLWDLLQVPQALAARWGRLLLWGRKDPQYRFLPAALWGLWDPSSHWHPKYRLALPVPQGRWLRLLLWDPLLRLARRVPCNNSTYSRRQSISCNPRSDFHKLT